MTVITSPANAAVKAARRLARRRARDVTGAFLVEGPAVVDAAVPHLRRVFVTPQARARHAELLARVRAAGAAVLTVAEPVLGTLADTVTPQGLVGVATLPAVALDVVLARAGLVVALADARDPGNVGTAVRTADAAGADAVVLSAGSADPRNPKAVRASAGSLFHLPVVVGPAPAELVAAARAAGLRAVAADARAARAYTDVDLARPTLLLFGGEAHGLPAGVVDVCDVGVRVPIAAPRRPGYAGAAESLNLAAAVAVLAFDAARQRGFPQPRRETVEHTGP